MQDYDFIETPENVILQRRLAGIGTRLMAGLVDHLIIAGLFLVLTLMFSAVSGGLDIFSGGQAGNQLGYWALAVFILIGFIIYWGYFLFFEMGTNGQSPGKKTQKIRVVKDSGGAISFTDIAVRNLIRAVDGIGGYAVAGICMFFTGKIQRLGDMAAGTVVISEAPQDYSARSDKRDKVEWEPEVSAEALQATGLNPEEFSALMNYYARREQLTDEAKRRLLAELVQPILERHGFLTAGNTTWALEKQLAELIGRINEAERKSGACGSNTGEDL